MDSSSSNNAASLQRLADDALLRDYPDWFTSREEWDVYNEECDRRYRSRAHLKGIGTDLSDTNNFLEENTMNTMNSTINTVQPKPEYFTTPTAHSGTVLNHKNVFGKPTRKSNTEVWRVWVRILTTEGWVLMGYIGSAATETALPAIRKGVRVELDPIILSDWKRVAGMDERSKDFSRTLKGMIVGYQSPTAPSGAIGSAPKNSNDYSDFAMPPVFALIKGNDAVVFIPNPWKPNHVMTRSINNLYTGGTWWFDSAYNTLTKDSAVEDWEHLVSNGYNARNLMKDRLNWYGKNTNCSDLDMFAILFSRDEYKTFDKLVAAMGGDYPRKTNNA